MRLLVWLVLATACDASTVAVPDGGTTFAAADLAGSWRGVAVRAGGESLVLALAVDGGGAVSGDGVTAAWTIDAAGEVSGGGTIAAHASSGLLVGGAVWMLRMSGDRAGMMGTLEITSHGVYGVTLLRQ